MWAAPRWLFPNRNRSCFLREKANRAGEAHIRLPAGAGDCRIEHQGTSRWKGLKEGSSRWTQQQRLITLERWNSFFPQILHILYCYQQQGAWFNRTGFSSCLFVSPPPLQMIYLVMLGYCREPQFCYALHICGAQNSKFHWAWFLVKHL